jgi:hypothetical protein
MRKKIVSSLLLAISATLVAASSSVAATPTGEFSVFAQCPYETSGVHACIYAQTTSGEFVVGKKTVPITKTITLQGGISENEAEENELVAATNGETLSKTPQNVPGGLAGLVNCKEIKEFIEKILCEYTLENSVTGVSATTELAQGASAVRVNTSELLAGEGVALRLPVKVHLENPFLGSECYIGSSSEPLTLELTTGKTSPPPPNKSIEGKIGTVTPTEEGRIANVTGNSLVDNAFAAPGVNGCGGSILSLILDPVVNTELGVPSAAGSNTAILSGMLKSANASAVRSHT